MTPRTGRTSTCAASRASSRRRRSTRSAWCSRRCTGAAGSAPARCSKAQGFRPIPVPGAGDAGRPVPERDEDAEPGSARVHGPGREAWPASTPPTWSSPPTRTPTASAAWRARRPTARATYRFITGNEIAALLTHFKLGQLREPGSLPASPIVITTEVTTGQITRIGRHVRRSGRERSARRVQVPRRRAVRSSKRPASTATSAARRPTS